MYVQWTRKLENEKVHKDKFNPELFNRNKMGIKDQINFTLLLISDILQSYYCSAGLHGAVRCAGTRRET